MKLLRVRMLLPVVALALGLAGCAAPVTPLRPPLGGLYTDISAPLTVDFNKTLASPSKVGTATSKYLLIPFTYGTVSFAWQPCNADLAARNGGITKIAYADYNYKSILGIYAEFTVTVRGD